MGFLDKIVNKEIKTGETLRKDLENVLEAKNGRTAVLVEYRENSGNHRIVALDKTGSIAMVYDHSDQLNIADRMNWGTDDIYGDLVKTASKLSKTDDTNRFHLFASNFSYAPGFVEYLSVVYSDYTLQKLYELNSLYSDNAIEVRRVEEIKDYEISNFTFYNKSIEEAFAQIEETEKRIDKAASRIKGESNLDYLTLLVSDAVGLDEKEDSDMVLIAAAEADGQSIQDIKKHSTGFLFVDILERLSRANEKGWVKLSDPKTGDPIETFNSKPKPIPSNEEKDSAPVDESEVYDADFERAVQGSESPDSEDVDAAVEITKRSIKDNEESTEKLIAKESAEEEKENIWYDETHPDEQNEEEADSTSEESEETHDQEEEPQEDDETEEEVSAQYLMDLNDSEDSVQAFSSEELLGASDEEYSSEEEEYNAPYETSDITTEEDLNYTVIADPDGESITFSAEPDDDNYEEEDDITYSEEDSSDEDKNLPSIDPDEVSTISVVNNDTERNDYDSGLMNGALLSAKRDIGVILEDLIREKNSAQFRLERISPQRDNKIEERERASIELGSIEQEIKDLEEELDEARIEKNDANDKYEHLSRIVDEKHALAVKSRHKYAQADDYLEKLSQEKEFYADSVRSFESAIERAKVKKPEIIKEFYAALNMELDQEENNTDTDEGSEENNENDVDPDRVNLMVDEGGGVINASKVDKKKFRGDFIESESEDPKKVD